MARRRLWLISPEGFRELRHSCLLSRKAAAEYLGVCVRTIRHWDSGRNRVPWSAVRLLRLARAGELGGFDDAWEGWTISRHGLRSPCGRVYTIDSLRHWWLIAEQARFWRDGYEAATRPSAGDPVPDAARVADGDSLLIAKPGRRADSVLAAPVGPAPAHPRRTALPRLPAIEKAPAAPAAGTAAGAAGRRPGAPLAGGREQRSAGGRDAIVAPQCSHEDVNGDAILGACNMQQTAPVSHSSLPETVCGRVPWANRGPTNLNGKQSDVNLASLPEPSCKGVA